MRSLAASLVLVALVGCGRIGFDGPGTGSGGRDSGAGTPDARDGGTGDAGADAPPAFRVRIDITNPGSAKAAYPVQVALPYSIHMQAGFDDIRFMAADGVTPLGYWRESYTASTSATFWVNVPMVPSGASAIYAYYGQPGVPTTSDGNATFDFFDDFRGTTLDTSKWSISTSGTGTVAVHNGVVCDNPSVDSSTAIILVAGAPSFGVITGSHAIEFSGSIKESGVPFRPFGFALHVDNETTASYIALSNFDQASNLRITNQMGAGVYSSSGTIAGYTSNPARWRFFGDGTTTHVLVNGQETKFSSTYPTGTTPERISFGPISTGGNNPNQVALAWVFIRKRAAAEPTMSLGPEEHL